MVTKDTWHITRAEIARMRRLAAAGHSMRKIADIVGRSRTTVRRCLSGKLKPWVKKKRQQAQRVAATTADDQRRARAAPARVSSGLEPPADLKINLFGDEAKRYAEVRVRRFRKPPAEIIDPLDPASGNGPDVD